MVLGILVVEDLVGVVLMVLLSTLAVSKQFEGAEMLGSILKLGAFLIFWSLLGIYLIPTLLKRLQRLLNDETLLIVALGLCLGMVMIAVKAGFSAALGAFVMGYRSWPKRSQPNGSHDWSNRSRTSSARSSSSR